MTDMPTWDQLDAWVDTDPIELRDFAFKLIGRFQGATGHVAQLEADNARLRSELEAVRDIAYRAGPGGYQDALQAIHQRASRALTEGEQ